ncbi:MAG: ACT domain-containing protein [Bacillota bacterium]|nr:ACT domain-containing protein [Bacillota bacterium]
MKGRIIITVIGSDKVGITAKVTAVLAKNNINILDINQTIMQDIFTMIMLCDMENATVELVALQEELNKAGEEIGMKIQAQHEDIFTYMHRI